MIVNGQIGTGPKVFLPLAAMSIHLSRAIRTPNSSHFIGNANWAYADCVVEARAVIIDRQSEDVLFVYDEKLAMYTLPRTRSSDLDALLWSPLQAAELKSGLHCARLPLPRMVKGTEVSADRDWNKAQTEVGYIGGEITSPFIVSFDTEWRTVPEDKWKSGYQVITNWFTGYIEDKDVDRSVQAEDQQPPYILLSLKDALSRLEDRDKDGFRALSVFEQMLVGFRDIFGSLPWQ